MYSYIYCALRTEKAQKREIHCFSVFIKERWVGFIEITVKYREATYTDQKRPRRDTNGVGEDEVNVTSGLHAQKYRAIGQGKDQGPELPFVPVVGVRKVLVGGVGMGAPFDAPRESTSTPAQDRPTARRMLSRPQVAGRGEGGFY